MSAPDIYTGRVIQATPAVFLGRAAAEGGTGPPSPDEAEGNLILQADVKSAQVKVFDASSVPHTLVGTYDLDVADTVMDELQTTGIWAGVEHGGNLRVAVPLSAFPSGGIEYRVESLLILQDDSPLPGLWEVPATNLYSAVITPGSNLGFTAGSVLFVGQSGVVTEMTDDSVFYFDNWTEIQGGKKGRLALGEWGGTPAPVGVIHIRQPNNITPLIAESESNTAPGTSFYHYFTSASNLLGGNHTGFRAAGTRLAPTAALDNYACDTLRGRAFTSPTTNGTVAIVQLRCDGDASPGSSSGKAVIATTPPGSTNTLDRVLVNSLGTVCLAAQGAVATGATAGFTELPSCPGTPTGVPTILGGVPVVIDTAASKLWAYIGGAWKSVAFA